MPGTEVTYSLDDPRERARQAPYTFFLPSQDRLNAIGPGDHVKLIFRPSAPGTKWEVERMWVHVLTTQGDAMTGLLDNDPEDVPGLAAGAEVCFLRWHVISVDFADPEYDLRHPSSTRRQYWDRCLVDQAVVDGTLPVEFIYRVEPDPPLPEDKYPDSGWRIRGDARNATDEELDAREAVYVATGAVLNRDDSWLHLIDEPVGSAFMRDFETGEYLPAFDAEDVTE